MDKKLTLDDIQKNYNIWASASTVPDKTKFKRYPVNYVFDETKSVKWNREEAVKANESYTIERNRLIMIAQSFYSSFKNAAIVYIEQETGLADIQAAAILEYALDRFDNDGSIADDIDDLIELHKFLVTDVVKLNSEGGSNERPEIYGTDTNTCS